MPIRFTADQLAKIQQIAKKASAIIGSMYEGSPDVFIDTLRVKLPKKIAGKHSGDVDIAVKAAWRYEGKRSPNRAGHYEPDRRAIVLFAKQFRGSVLASVEEVLSHELGHAIDLLQSSPRERADVFEHRNAKVSVLVDGVRVEETLARLVADDVRYVNALLRPGTLPRRLDTADARAKFVAKAVLRDLEKRKLFAFNPGLKGKEERVLDLILSYVIHERNVERYEEGLDPVQCYLRTETEMKAFTQSTLADVRQALREGTCGSLRYLPSSGTWGTKCATLVTESSRTFRDLDRHLTEEQRRRVLSDIAKVLRKDYFEADEKSPAIEKTEPFWKKRAKLFAERIAKEGRPLVLEAAELAYKENFFTPVYDYASDIVRRSKGYEAAKAFLHDRDAQLAEVGSMATELLVADARKRYDALVLQEMEERRAARR